MFECSDKERRKINLDKTATLHKASAKILTFLCRLSTDSKQKVQINFLKNPCEVQMFALNLAAKVEGKVHTCDCCLHSGDRSHRFCFETLQCFLRCSKHRVWECFRAGFHQLRTFLSLLCSHPPGECAEDWQSEPGCIFRWLCSACCSATFIEEQHEVV